MRAYDWYSYILYLLFVRHCMDEGEDKQSCFYAIYFGEIISYVNRLNFASVSTVQNWGTNKWYKKVKWYTVYRHDMIARKSSKQIFLGMLQRQRFLCHKFVPLIKETMNQPESTRSIRKSNPIMVTQVIVCLSLLSFEPLDYSTHVGFYKIHLIYFRSLHMQEDS